MLIPKHRGCRWRLNTTYPHADKVRKLSIGVDIHLDDTVIDGGVDLLRGGAGPTVEDKVPGEESSVREITDMWELGG